MLKEKSTFTSRVEGLVSGMSTYLKINHDGLLPRNVILDLKVSPANINGDSKVLAVIMYGGTATITSNTSGIDGYATWNSFHDDVLKFSQSNPDVLFSFTLEFVSDLPIQMWAKNGKIIYKEGKIRFDPITMQDSELLNAPELLFSE